MRPEPAFLARLALACTLVALGPSIRAETLRVGPGKPYASLQAVANLLDPGDVVEVDGDFTYTGGVILTRSGTPAQKITIRGVRINGNRPRLVGGTNTIEFRLADHYVFEQFDVSGGSFRCIYHHADDLTVRDVVVHDCPAHGILGADQDSGSLLLERVEVHHCGSGTTQHQIYVATDEVSHPGSVFRMRHCYVHDATGGNNVKSRAERNEIHYNWIEGALYHELELIGPDPAGAPAGWSEDLAREDSDIVGNVLLKRNTFNVVRIGGDGTGQSNGRYRFVNNTILAGTSAVFRIFDGIQSVEMHNNVVHRADGGVVNLVRQVEAAWTDGEQISGSRNWTTTGSINIPAAWTGTATGASPGFTSIAANDLRPVAGSPLLDRANASPASATTFPFPQPLFPPAFNAPSHAVESVALGRTRDCGIDIGAYERSPVKLATWGLVWPDETTLAWQATPGATSYDVVKGSLDPLAASEGDFTSSIDACLANDAAATSVHEIDVPPAGEAFFYLVRPAPGGTYDETCPGALPPRDASIAASPLACS